MSYLGKVSFHYRETLNMSENQFRPTLSHITLHRDRQRKRQTAKGRYLAWTGLPTMSWQKELNMMKCECKCVSLVGYIRVSVKV